MLAFSAIAESTTRMICSLTSGGTASYTFDGGHGEDAVIGMLLGQRGGIHEIDALHPTEIERAAVREDQPVPGNEHAVLTEGDAAVVLTDQPTSLRDQKESTGATVVDVAPDECRRLARQVGIDAGRENRRNERPGRDSKRRTGRTQRADG